MDAYILIQCEVGKTANVARRVAEINEVTESSDITGPYDVIVRAQQGSTAIHNGK